MKETKIWWTPILNIAIHVFVGSTIFLVVGAPAVALSLLVHYLEGLHIPSFTITVLTFLEQAITVIDFVAVLIYIGTSTYREMEGLLDE